MDDVYTIADMYALAILRIGRYLTLPLDEYPSLINYMQRLESRPAIQKVLEIEQKAEIETRVWDRRPLTVNGQINHQNLSM